MNASLVILAGGKSTRYGNDKAFIKIDGRLLIELLINRLGSLFDDVLIASGTGKKFPSNNNFREIPDIYCGKGPLGGLHASLKALKTEWAFVVACDMPNVGLKTVQALHSAISKDVYIAAPCRDGAVQPLCAFYHRKCIDTVEHLIKNERLSMHGLFDTMPVCRVEIKDDFLNVNYPEDIYKIRLEPDSSACKEL